MMRIPPSKMKLYHANLLLLILLPLLYFHLMPLMTPKKLRNETIAKTDFSQREPILNLFLHLQNKYLLDSDLIYDSPGSKKFVVYSVNTNQLTQFNQSSVVDETDYVTIQAYYTLAYCIYHGYSYRFFRLNPPSIRETTWLKYMPLSELVSRYKYSVFLDSDASFANFPIGLENMMRRWDISSKTIFASALDPPFHKNNYYTGKTIV